MTLTIILFVAAVIAGADQLIKYFILENLAPVHKVSVIDGLFSLVYVENRGVAFGMLQNHVWIFAVITTLLIGVIIYLIAAKKFTGKLFYTAAALMIGGGVGNLIDRIFRGFVVDYLSVSFFPPVCNLADYCITIGAFLFILVLLLPEKKKGKYEAGNRTTFRENVSKAGEKSEESAEAGAEDVKDGD